ncbi:MAG: GAF domain-containing protein [Leptolyngbyaceae bacterium]|nr:GAF domain-containing protein [Leptolyngbyaceae bacterium]
MPNLVVDAIASPPISDCSQLEPHFTTQSSPPKWETDRHMQDRHVQLLEATARAANVLLTLENLSEAIYTALNIIGEGAGCDLIAVIENRFESTSPLPAYCNFIYEWATPGLTLPTARLSSKSLPSDFIGLEFLKKYFLEGSGFGGPLEDWNEPLRSWLASVQVQSAYTVPIRVNGQWWGVLCFDYCRAPIQIDSAELAVLRTIANCIGSAIERDRLQQERQQVAQQRTADLEAYNQVLQGRDRLFEATAKVANVLLTVENFEEAINTALGMFLEAAGCDRISVLENILESSSPLPVCYKFIYEWATPGFSIRPTESELECISTEAIGKNFLEISAKGIGKDFLEQYFLRGEGFGGLLEEWDEPLRSSLAAAHVKSSYYVPIRVNGRWWGLLGFDYCRAAIQISPAEIAVLRTIADCIGSAIQRDRTYQERKHIILQRAEALEAYNQVLQGRDRLFEATAKAANVLLTLDNFDAAVNTALQFIGEGTGCDCVVVLENMFQSASPLPSSCEFIYEWAAPGWLPISVSFGSTSLPSELLGLDFMRQYFLDGDGFGGLTEVWNEPLRSALVSVQVQSTYAVPIRVNGQWWGVLSLDYCRAPIQVSTAEISVLMAIADCIGSAIQRDRTQKTMLQAEQTRVAELVKANTTLKQSLDTFAADSDLDRFIGNTLTAIAQQFDAPLIEYWVHSQAGSEASIHLAYWQGQILSAANGSIVKANPLGMISFLDIPLSVGDTNIGALSIYTSVHRTFSRQTIELAHALAQQLTLAVELTRLAEEAQQSALLQERTRMAREIHDTLAQTFGGILMQLQAFTYFAQTQPDQAQTHLLTAQALAQEGLTEARRSVWTLYLETTEYENLDQAIAKFIEQTQPRQATPIHLEIEGTPYTLHPDLGLNLLRIAQEAITNALRHANATTIQVHLSYSAQILQLTIRDNGCGFEPQSSIHGFGLLGMQQRASRMGAIWNLSSRTGQGTTLMITLNNGQNTLISKA